MNVTIMERHGQRYAQAVEGQLLHTAEDVVDLIGFCLENRVDRLLLYAGNLTERFFDLSSGEAGMVLQKFRNYGLQVAVIWSPDQVAPSRHFGEMLTEESRGANFRVFDSCRAAVAWLVEADRR